MYSSIFFGTLFLVLPSLGSTELHGNGCPTSLRVASHNTLLEVQNRVRSLLATCNLTKDLYVILDSGFHALNHPLLFDHRDSGNNGHNVVWEGKRDPRTLAPAIVSGGIVLSNWSEDSESGYLVHPAPPALSGKGARQMFATATRGVTSSRAYRSKISPDAAGLSSTAGAKVTDEGIVTPSWAPWSWKNPEDVELYVAGPFTEQRCTVDSVEVVTVRTFKRMTLVRMKQPCWSFGIQQGVRWVEDLTSVLNTAGPDMGPCQWTYDRPNKRFLYHAQPGGIDCPGGDILSGSARLIVPASPGLIFANKVENIRFKDIAFMYSAWDAPSSGEGYLERYGGVVKVPCSSSPSTLCYGKSEVTSREAGCQTDCALVMARAAVEFRSSRNVGIDGCEFSNNGAWGLSLSAATQYVSVTDSKFKYNSGGGIYIGNVNETMDTDPSKFMSGIRIAGNWIAEIGQEYKGSTAIHTFGTVDSVIEHNGIRQTPYTAISFNWPVPQSYSYSKNNLIRANYISYPSLWGSDGGAIHTIGKVTNVSFVGNYISHQTHGNKVTYIDNDSSGFNISDHVINDAPDAIWLFLQQMQDPKNHSIAYNIGHDNHAWNCYVYNSRPSPFPYNTSNCTVSVEYYKPSQWDPDHLPRKVLDIISRAGPWRGEGQP